MTHDASDSVGRGGIRVIHGPRFQNAPKEWTERTPPYLILDGIYYVGTEDLGSYLITSLEGHVLIDTGVEQNAACISDNIRTLGFNVKDVRMMLTTQAHYDHVGAFARLKKESREPECWSRRRDAPLVEGGGKG